MLRAGTTDGREGGQIDMAERRAPQSRLALALTAAVGILIAGVGTLGWRWYRYVTAGDTPYDEVGIEINLRLPEPLRAWG